MTSFACDSSSVFKSQGLASKITTVSFRNYCILVGEGNTIQVYNTSLSSVTNIIQVFKETSVHGIRFQANEAETGLKYQDTVAVFGGSNFAILQSFSNYFLSLKKYKEESSLGDWIWDAQWVSRSSLAFVLAHNTVILWCCSKNCVQQRVTCEEKCILYSATIVGNRWPDIICIAGTVFSQVIVWSLASQSENVKILHRLCGHQGVIFCVTYSSQLRLLCSTSDDRSLRLWRHHCEGGLWENGHFELVHVLFGHESRVWRALIARHFILSIGEDSVLCVWSHAGQLLVNQKYQSGGLLSLAVDQEEDHAIVAGESLSLINIVQLLASQASTTLQLPVKCDQNTGKVDFPRGIVLFGHNEVAVSTDAGSLLQYDVIHETWTELHSSTTYQSYSFLSVSPCREILSWGNIMGELLLLKNTESDVCCKSVFQVHFGKVFSVLWLSSSEIFTCGPEGELHLWNAIKERGIELNQLCTFLLPSSKQRWASAACKLNDLHCVVGDRVGNIHVYSRMQREPVQTCRAVHGRSGVTCLCFAMGKVYSAGQDGRVLVHLFHEGKIDAMYSIKKPSRMEWIGKVIFCESSLLLIGFHSVNLSVWSHNLQRPLLEFICGGGHRSWDFNIDLKRKVTFACIRKQEIKLWKNISLEEKVLRAGFHGNKIWCVCPIMSSSEAAYIASGGEDNCIVLSKLKEDDVGRVRIEHIERLGSHISSVRALASCAMDDLSSTRVMVSAGGRAQVVVWKLQWNLLTEQFDCHEVANEFLWSVDRPHRKPWQKESGVVPDPQTRYMDVAVWQLLSHISIILGCSDACLRGYVLHTNDWNLEPTFVYQAEFCILRVLPLREFSLLVVGSTDGTVKFWDLSNGIDMPSPKLSLSVHQNGVNAIDVLCISLTEDKWHLATGGDDNGLVIHAVSIHSDSVSAKMLASIPSAHAAQITGVKFLTAELLLSVGLDQRLCLWHYLSVAEANSLKPIASTATIIPDIAALYVFNSDQFVSQWRAIVVGEGLEMFFISGEEIYNQINK